MEPPSHEVLSFNEEKTENKFIRKAKDAPFMVGGIIGLVGSVGYGAYAYKNRGKMSTSVYLMQLRVMAQSAVIGALVVGVIGSMAKNLLYPKEKKQL